MKKLYSGKFIILNLIALATFITYAFADGKKPYKPDTAKSASARVANGRNDRSYLKNGIHISLPPLKPYFVPTGTTSKVSLSKIDPDKTLSNVQVFPNPITDQINLRYMVTRSSNVSIKIVDILGNEIISLFSQHVEPGEQKFSYNFSNKLSSGFYFVRLVVGNESIIKRITIL
jgi:hypothetical protein